MKEFFKFITAGSTSTLIDFIVLNLLLILTGVRSGIFYSLIRAFAFLCGATNSYIWNKFWVFKNNKKVTFREYFEFLSLALIAGVIDVLISSLVVNFVNPPFSFITPLVWANVSAAIGSLPSLFFRFLSYKKIVFQNAE